MTIPFETPVSTEVNQYHDGHNFVEGKAAPGKPRPAGICRRQTAFTVTLKPGTEVTGITKNSGYTVVIHKKPLPFPV
jgi:hypothetical protein